MKEGLELEKPEEDTEKALIVVPGINSGPHGRLFDDIVEFAKTQKYQVIRINAWDGPKDLEEKTLKQLHNLIDKAAKNLRENGSKEITILGKSFGGQLTLTNPKTPEIADKIILWAPALDIQKEGNIAKWRTTQLKKAEQATDIKITKQKLSKIPPTTIIHGKQDQVVPIENSRKLQKHIPKCELKEIEKTGHSYKGKDSELLKQTKEEI